MLKNIVAALVLPGALLLSSNAAIAANEKQSVGMNLNQISNWVTSVPFVDLFKSGTEFPAVAGVSYDDQGWPTGLPAGVSVRSTIAVTELSPALPTGNYIVTYEGSGQLSYGGTATLQEQGAGRDVLSIDPSSRQVYLYVDILSSDYSDPIRNIKITLPGGICSSNPFNRVNTAASCGNNDYLAFEDYSEDIIFNPDFLRFAKDFRVLRYMDFMKTNGSAVSRWDERTRMDDAFWSGAAGAPIEVMVALANRADANPWFNMPHLATDNYIRQFANYTRDNLDSNLKAYVEYSNEVWSDKAQGNYARNLGSSMGLSTNWGQGGARYYAQRSVEVFNLWQQQFGGLERMVRVLGGQVVNTWLTEQVLTWQSAYESADVFGVNLYITALDTYLDPSNNVSDIFAAMRSEDDFLALPTKLENVREQAELANKYGLNLVAFEGGQGLVDWSSTYHDEHPNQLFYAANRDSRMKTLYTDMLNGWKNSGGDLFVAYAAPIHYNKSGSWGIMEYIGQSRATAPKYDALLSYMENNNCWWDNCAGNAGVQDTVTVTPVDTDDSSDSSSTDNSSTDNSNNTTNDNNSGTDTGSSNESTTDTSTGSSNAVVSTFGQAATYYSGNQIRLNGKIFTSQRYGNFAGWADTENALSPYWGDVVHIAQENGAVFELASFEVKGRWSGINSQVEVTAIFADGSSDTKVVAYDGSAWKVATLNWKGIKEMTISTHNGRVLMDRFIFSVGATDTSNNNGEQSETSTETEEQPEVVTPNGTTTLDFESTALGGFNGVALQGYQFNPTVKPTFEILSNANNNVLTPAWGEIMKMRRSDAAAFELESLQYKGRWAGINGTITVVGVKSDGSEVASELDYNASGWSNRTLNWSNLKEVYFSTPDGRVLLDNLVVSQ